MKGHVRERILNLKEHVRGGANNFTGSIVKAIPLFKLEQQASCVTYNGTTCGAFCDGTPFPHEGRFTDKSGWKLWRNVYTSEGDWAGPRSRLEQKTAPATTNERRPTNTSNSHRTSSHVKAKGFIHSSMNCSTTVNDDRARSQNRENLLRLNTQHVNKSVKDRTRISTGMNNATANLQTDTRAHIAACTQVIISRNICAKTWFVTFVIIFIT